MKKWSLQHLLFILSFVLSCETGAAVVIHVSGYEGRDVNVSCNYKAGYESYEKYLCRNGCGNSDVLIMTTQAQKKKYSIADDTKERVLTTTISNLTVEDGGTYWCGVTITGKDYYPAEVNLKVVADHCCDHSTKLQHYEEDSVSITCPYASENHSDLKYMCRGKQPSTCLQQAEITSDSRQNGRFRLTDDTVSRKFTVNITNLTQKDSGSYLCGTHRSNGLDAFSAVELEVKEWCCVKSNKLRGIVGRPLTMQCRYPPQHKTNRKFLCKGDHRNRCTNINSGQTDGRFTLQDDVSSSSFSVTITELTEGDAGVYWCGSDQQWEVANYTKIQLSVVFETRTVVSAITVETVTSQSQTTHTLDKPISDASHISPVVFIVPAVVLLVLTFALAAVFKHKCHKVQGAATNTTPNVIKSMDLVEVICQEQIYQNQDVVVYSKQGASKLHFDETGGDQYDSMDQNSDATDNIYCNQAYIKATRK